MYPFEQHKDTIEKTTTRMNKKITNKRREAEGEAIASPSYRVL